MKNAARKNKKKILSLTSKMLIPMFVLVAITVITPVAYASKDNDRDVRFREEITMFDPFSIKAYSIESTSLRNANGSNSSITSTIKTNSLMNRPQIRIPFRPTPRSPFKPTYLNQ